MQPSHLINADDFGFSASVNAAIYSLLKKKQVNIVSILSLFVRENDLARLRRIDNAYLSAHISLIEGVPLCLYQEVPSLVNKWGYLHSLPIFLIKLFLRQIDFLEVENEITAQIQFLDSHGIHPHFMDSHQHVHHFSPLVPIFERVMKKNKITKIRGVKSTKKYLKKYPIRYCVFIVTQFILGKVYGHQTYSMLTYEAEIIHPGSTFEK